MACNINVQTCMQLREIALLQVRAFRFVGKPTCLQHYTYILICLMNMYLTEKHSHSTLQDFQNALHYKIVCNTENLTNKTEALACVHTPNITCTELLVHHLTRPLYLTKPKSCSQTYMIQLVLFGGHSLNNEYCVSHKESASFQNSIVGSKEWTETKPVILLLVNCLIESIP